MPKLGIRISRGSGSRGGSRECCFRGGFWRIILNNILLIAFVEVKDNLVILNDSVIDIVLTILCFSKAFVGDNICVKALDISHFLQ